MTSGDTAETERCSRHPERATRIHCTRCGNPVCTDCMVPAAVGHHCPACIAAAHEGDRRARPVDGGFRRLVSRPGAVVTSLFVVNVAIVVVSSRDPTLLSRFGNDHRAIVEGEYYRLLTHAFLHATTLHLAMNMLTLAAVAGGTLSLLIGPSGSVGASGALFGATGALALIIRRRGLDVRPLIWILAVNLLVGMGIPRIDIYAHVGGLITGIAVGRAFEWSEYRPRRLALDAAMAVAVGFALVGLAIGGGRLVVRPRDTMRDILQAQEAALERAGDLAR